jgi:hypothetical protein
MCGLEVLHRRGRLRRHYARAAVGPHESLIGSASPAPTAGPKLLWPVGLTTVLLVSYGFADVERWACRLGCGRRRSAPRSARSCFWSRSWIGRTGASDDGPVNFDERPALATQRLGLFDRIANPDGSCTTFGPGDALTFYICMSQHM